MCPASVSHPHGYWIIGIRFKFVSQDSVLHSPLLIYLDHVCGSCIFKGITPVRLIPWDTLLKKIMKKLSISLSHLLS